MTEFILNGTPVTVGDHHEHLLTALRDELGVMSPKDGCAPSGQCGCCTVMVDGKARVACQTSLDKTAGTEVLTLEGVDAGERDAMSAAFAAHGALQCGFCTPGIVMRTKAMVDKKGADLTRDNAAALLGAHLCRCTGYIKILDAIEGHCGWRSSRRYPAGRRWKPRHQVRGARVCDGRTAPSSMTWCPTGFCTAQSI